VYFLFPETNGRHLEQVDQIFLKSTSIFDTVAVARNMPKGSLHVDDEKVMNTSSQMEYQA
jgi:hypothetical protein